MAQRFEWLLEVHRRPGGGRWTGAELEKATGGVVTRSYATNLRKGRIENPGYLKLKAIAKAMGFGVEEWFESLDTTRPETPDETLTVAQRVQHLVEAVENPNTGEPYSDAEIARMSGGDLSEEEVEWIRTGGVADPTVSQVAALAEAFGVDPSYLVVRKGTPLLSREAIDALGDETVREIACTSALLPEREKRIVLGIVERFAEGSGVSDAY